MLRFPDQFLLVEGAGASMGAELRLYPQYPWEGGEPAPHGSVCLLDLVSYDGVGAAQIQGVGEWAGGCLYGERAAGLDAFGR